MPTALSDPSLTVTILLTAMTAILGAMAWRRRQKGDGIRFLISAVLLGTVLLIDRLVQSPREQVVASLQDMSRTSANRNYDQMLSNVSEQFQHRSLKKKGLSDLIKRAENYNFTGMEIWGFTRDEFRMIDENTVEQGFRAQPKGYPQLQKFVVATFRKESDGVWRMTTFRLYNPINRNEEETIPNF